MKTLLGGIVNLSSVDYPGHPSAVVFFARCSFKCPFCQNPQLVNPNEECTEVDNWFIIDKIKENMPFIDSVVFTGGDPLLQADNLKDLLGSCKQLRLLTKLDTSGVMPEQLKKVIDLLDYVAIDIKTRLDPQRYSKATGVKITKTELDNLKKSLKLVKDNGKILELRTTVVPTLVDEDDIAAIARELKPDIYYVQQFRPDKTLDPLFSKLKRTDDKTLVQLAKIAKQNGAKEVWIRGDSLEKI